VEGRLKVGLDASFMMTFDPEYSLKYLTGSEEVGFDYLWLGDHYLPWHDSFEHSFFVWEVLAATAAKTSRVRVGPDVTVPIGGRYHPAIIAQASATMDRLFPGRFVLGVGAGEAMNESWFFGTWPNWGERMERLTEGVALIRKLWSEKDYFRFDGKYFKMGMTKLYLRPAREIPIYVSALGKRSAYQAGRIADRLMSSGSAEQMRDVVFPSFDAGARSEGRDPSTIEKAVLMDMATGREEDIAERIRRLSIGSAVSGMVNEPDPRKIEQAGGTMKPEDVLKNVLHFTNADQVIDRLTLLRRIGASQVIIGDMSTEPDKAMRIYSEAIRYLQREESR
jgi:coenzyme F420-dependent glucose-6-phosphate dehydrogenase